MKSKLQNVQKALGAILAVIIITASCSSEKNREEETNYDLLISNDSIPEVIKKIARAVNENDASAFAREVGYPLQRPYPLKDILNQEEMKGYYTVIVDDSLRAEILNSGPADWQRYGWRGYSLKDGTYLWVDENIYDINYVSKREEELIDSLRKVETGSLPPSLRKGATPIMTFVSENGEETYRIDDISPDAPKGSPKYRLSVYLGGKKGSSLRETPDTMLDGYLRTEGSAPTVSYVFPDGTNAYVIYPDDPATGIPSIVFPDGTEMELRKAYWHELIK